MQISDLNSFIQARTALAPEIQEFLASEKLVYLIDATLGETHPRRTDVLAYIGDYIVGIKTRDALKNDVDLSSIIKGSNTDSDTLLKEVDDAVSKINSGNPKKNVHTAPIHTMADDVEKVQGYESLYGADEETPVHSSSQEQVLTKQTVADTPQYDDTQASQSTIAPDNEEVDTRWQSNL